MRYCPNCGEQVQEDARFCPACGREQARILTPDAPGVPPPPRQPSTVGQGFGWATGGFLFGCLALFVIVVVLPMLLFASCMVIGASGGS